MGVKKKKKKKKNLKNSNLGRSVNEHCSTVPVVLAGCSTNGQRFECRPGDGEDDGQDDDRGHVLQDPLAQSVCLVHGLAVVYRVVHCDEPLQGYSHCHEDGPSDGDL